MAGWLTSATSLSLSFKCCEILVSGGAPIVVGEGLDTNAISTSYLGTYLLQIPRYDMPRRDKEVHP